MSFLSTPLSLFPIRPRRSIGEINLTVVTKEDTNDTLTVTKQPVQQGASISDHAYKEPTAFTCSAYFQENLTTALDRLYQDLIDLQSSRVPFDIVTPKRIYRSMLLTVLTQTTDKTTEACLAVNMTFQEVLIVKVSTAQVPRINQSNAGATGKTENAGKKSALLSLKEGIGAVFR